MKGTEEGRGESEFLSFSFLTTLLLVVVVDLSNRSKKKEE
jgi:hypothetical protein